MHPLLAGEQSRLRMEQLHSEAAIARRHPRGRRPRALRQSLGLVLVRAGMLLLDRIPEPERPPDRARLAGSP